MIGEAAFLAAHAFLIWGDASDARLIANLMDESYARKVFAVVARGGPAVYPVGDMATMAAAKVSGEKPEDVGMEPITSKYYCPFAKAASVFSVAGERRVFIEGFLRKVDSPVEID